MCYTIYRFHLRCKPFMHSFFRYQSTKKTFEDVEISKIRNFGILAHIDAGKTTTTERMLYYAGLINEMGEVHHGNTVTDFMEQERERGITISSAAVTLFWKKYQFNLIDTPGHIDFTMEVEQTLNVLDGAVVVLDGSAGVEAQTLTVWRQANKYNIPRVVFVNKMDRQDADLRLCCKSIEDKLQVTPLCVHFPIVEHNALTGIVDLVTMEKVLYDKNNKNSINRAKLSESENPILWAKAEESRSLLIDQLSGFDDMLADKIISLESFNAISSADIINALRLVTLKRKAVPVLLGSAYKNVGIQPLMDSIVLYLPSPIEQKTYFKSFENNLCARAFKVRHDKQRGVLVFFRIYNGTLLKGQKLYNIQQDRSELCSKLFVGYADEFREVDSIKNGNIAVVSGLKEIVTGDLMTSSQSSAQRAKNNMLKNVSKTEHALGESSVDSLFGVGPQIPEPVFFCSIEPPSLAYQTALEQALIELQREDPSLRVTTDAETGQTILSGMGELHIEIIKDRILREYKINADLGPIQISYLESPRERLTDSLTMDMKIGSLKQRVNIQLTLIPTEKFISNNNVLKFDKSPEAAANLAHILPKHVIAIKQGIEVGLTHGPKMSCRVVNSEVMLHRFEVGRGTSESIISATVTQLLQKILKSLETNILEPIMFLEIAAPDDFVSIIIADLSRRRASIRNVFLRGSSKVVSVNVPLAELLGYSTVLRTITSGTATFTMEFDEYKVMSALEETNVIQKIHGF